MIEIKPMDESYIHIDCLHHGSVDPSSQPSHGDIWQDAPDLPPHPWSDEVIFELAKKYNGISEGWRGDPAREFMREMIRRYGSCAILAWEDGKVVGQLRFYPLGIAQLLAQVAPDKQPAPTCSAMKFEPDTKTLWIQCVMTSRPYEPDAVINRRWPTKEEAGARKGKGQKLVQGFISWVKNHRWKQIVKQAHADLDCMYGQYGGGGKAFWEKAGFKVIGSYYEKWTGPNEWKNVVETEAKRKGMSVQEAWTWYQMMYEL